MDDILSDEDNLISHKIKNFPLIHPKLRHSLKVVHMRQNSKIKSMYKFESVTKPC